MQETVLCDTDNLKLFIHRVDVHHDNRGASGHVSWAQNFTITLGGNIIELLQNHIVEVSYYPRVIKIYQGHMLHLHVEQYAIFCV